MISSLKHLLVPLQDFIRKRYWDHASSIRSLGRKEGIYPMGSTRRSVRWVPRRPSWTCEVLPGDVSSCRRLGEGRREFFHLDSIDLMREQAFLMIMHPVRMGWSAVKPLQKLFYGFQSITQARAVLPSRGRHDGVLVRRWYSRRCDLVRWSLWRGASQGTSPCVWGWIEERVPWAAAIAWGQFFAFLHSLTSTHTPRRLKLL